MKVQLYDTTLRDGAQREGISFSAVDKLHIARKLDELGIHFIEGGWPGSNPKDAEFFNAARSLHLKNAKLVAFGATRRPRAKAEKDANLLALADCGVEIAALVGKSSHLQVTQVLETTLEENLRMISDSIHFLRSRGMSVFFDAEHFFDGYKADPAYALRCLEAAAEAGASCLVLCDTNGGSLPGHVSEVVRTVAGAFKVPIGVHVHNDSGLAVACSLAAVSSGAEQVQGTINGYGERCGNANLCAVIPNLKLKLGIDCVTDEQLARLNDVAHYISEIANLVPDPFAPYVGSSAFAHKGGLHASGMAKWEGSYQHIDPALVGNKPRVIVSELSGKGNIIYKAKELGFDLSKEGDAHKLLEQVKHRESLGFQYDHAEASFELLIRRALPDYQPLFKLVDFMVIVEKRRRAPSRRSQAEEMLSEAIVKVTVGEEIMHTAAEGNGPVNALDNALRKALLPFYPRVGQVKLVDYKVRILEESTGTESQVRVLIESSDGADEWHTVGSSTNIIEASWMALADSLEYWLIKNSSKLNAESSGVRTEAGTQ
ncbi:MAG: citramalate synthase [Betaproteobacteria bacterium]|nr:citramalate synthase [Betaproteobacteria bacterium]